MFVPMCQLRKCRSICGRNYTASLILRTTLMRSQLLGRVSSVEASQTNKQKKQVSKKCTILILSLLYMLIYDTSGNSLVKIIFWRSAFASRRHARALAAGLPRQDHVYITTDNFFRFHNDEFDEISCKLDSTENSWSFKKYSTPP